MITLAFLSGYDANFGIILTAGAGLDNHTCYTAWAIGEDSSLMLLVGCINDRQLELSCKTRARKDL
jgi:hypothetical protein